MPKFRLHKYCLCGVITIFSLADLVLPDTNYFNFLFLTSDQLLENQNTHDIFLFETLFIKAFKIYERLAPCQLMPVVIAIITRNLSDHVPKSSLLLVQGHHACGHVVTPLTNSILEHTVLTEFLSFLKIKINKGI